MAGGPGTRSTMVTPQTTDNESLSRTREGPARCPREPQELWAHAGKTAFWGQDLVGGGKDDWKVRPGQRRHGQSGRRLKDEAGQAHTASRTRSPGIPSIVLPEVLSGKSSNTHPQPGQRPPKATPQKSPGGSVRKGLPSCAPRSPRVF